MEGRDRHGEHGARARRLQPAIGHALLALLFALLPLLAPAAAAKAPAKRTVLVVGDSLSAAYGLRHDEGWVVLLANQVAAERPDWQVANGSVSGHTSADGASHLLRDLERLRPQVVVIELGANDGLRGLPLQQTRLNLARMIGMAHGAGARVLLVGMRLPPNYGPAYVREFEAMYPALAKQFDVALLPFFLEPVASDRASFQADNMHPVATAQPRLRDHVWKKLEPLMH
jgi:acyl-CoA thioesterase I